MLPTMQKLLSRANFAEAAGVNASTVTRLSKTLLKEAVYGRYIDAAHPAALRYLKNRAPLAADGLDPLYDDAVSACHYVGRYSANFISKALAVGAVRARRIADSMAAQGVVQVPAPAPVAAPVAAPAPVAAKPRGQLVVKEAKKAAPVGADAMEVPENIQEFADMTLRDLVDKFGTDTRFVDWLSAIQKIEIINEKRLKNAATEGELVSRKLVRLGIIEPIDAAHIKLLTDGAKTIARRAVIMHDAKRPLGDIENFVVDQITSFIRPVKSKVARALKNV